MKTVGIAIRFILTGALLYGVWTETGWFTALAIGLIAIAIELHAVSINLLGRRPSGSVWKS